MKIQPDGKQDVVIFSEFEGDVAVVQESGNGLAFKIGNQHSPGNWYYIYLDSRGNLHVNNCTEREVLVSKGSQLEPPTADDMKVLEEGLRRAQKSVEQRFRELAGEKKCCGHCEK